MQLSRRAVVTGLLSLASGRALGQQSAPLSNPVPTDMRTMFEAFVSALDTSFYRVEKLREVNFRAKVEALWPEIKDLPRPADAAPRLNALLRELQTSHTQLFTVDDPEFYILADVFQAFKPSDPWNITPWLPNAGFFSTLIDGRHHITSILEGYVPATTDLSIGDEITASDGAPYHPVKSIHEKIGKTVTLTLRRAPGGSTHEATLKANTIVPKLAFDQAMQNSARLIMRGARRIGYVHIWHMRTPTALAQALATIDGSRSVYRGPDGKMVAVRRGEAPLQALDALIVDSRGKIGGLAGVAQDFLTTLRGPPGGYVQFEPRNASAPRRFASSFKGRCALLIDSNTRSAGELFAQGFKNEAIGPTYGSSTAGAVSGGSVERLIGPLLLYIATSRVTINGVDLEGVGVMPTHRVERPIPYSAGVDPVLAAALDHLA